MSFTEEEVAYMRSQPVARLATLGGDGQPDVVLAGEPVGDTWYASRKTVHQLPADAGR